jgi:hypothetical protein
MSQLGLIAGIGMVLASIWTGVQARWAPEARPTFVPAGGFLFTTGLCSIILSSTAGQVPSLRLLANISGCLSYLCLATWFLRALHRDAGRRVNTQLVLCSTTLVIGISAWMWDPTQVFRALVGTGHPTVVASVTFSLVIQGYESVVTTQIVSWSVRCRRLVREPGAQLGFALFAAALMVKALQNVLRLASVGLATIHHSWSPALLEIYLAAPAALRSPGNALMLAAAVCSGTASLIAVLPTWRKHRHQYFLLRPLRRELYRAFPQHALSPVTPLWRDWLLPVRVHRRFYRSVIEILDGLDQLRPFYDRAVAERANATVTSGGPDSLDQNSDYHVYAAVLRDAVNTHIAIERAARLAAAQQARPEETVESSVHNALTAEVMRRRETGSIYEDLARIGHGTMEQVTLKLVTLSAAIAGTDQDEAASAPTTTLSLR